jgi:hypothetical protein
MKFLNVENNIMCFINNIIFLRIFLSLQKYIINFVNCINRLGFKTTKCLGHLCCQNDFCPMFQHSSTCNEATWSDDYFCNFQHLGNIS